jgi:hypothetical protein
MKNVKRIYKNIYQLYKHTGYFFYQHREQGSFISGKPVPAGSLCDSCVAQKSDERNALHYNNLIPIHKIQAGGYQFSHVVFKNPFKNNCGKFLNK